MSRQSRQHGFTLIEIAIVLVIIGLLLGGILKGQELITSARVRNLISQQDGIKAAFYGFQDRYRALPGDYQLANANLSGAPTAGNGNGQIDDATSTKESILAWDHMTRAGFLNGNYVYSATVAESNTPKNPYGQFIQIIYDGVYGSGTAAAPNTARHNVKTGNQVPVEIVAEIDRKTDDGNPTTGSFVFSEFGGPTLASCTSGTAPAFTWALTISPSPVNCGGATLL